MNFKIKLFKILKRNKIIERNNSFTENKEDRKNDESNIQNNNLYEKVDDVSFKEIGTDLTYKHEIAWRFAITFTILHILVLWGLVVILSGKVSLKTLFWGFALVILASLGITIGAHRYYTHRSFKAKPALRAILILMHTLAGTFSIYHWCLVHRQHHRYSDTDGDPHNATRGFYFAQFGWLIVRSHPIAKKLWPRIDMSDLKEDWMVMFQKKYYFFLFIPISALAVWVPVHFFEESILNSYLVCFIVRYAINLHVSNSVNSFAHMYGTRPYDKKIHPVESWFVSAITLGEGWHNYHHTFPWDYKAAELFDFNISTKTIHFFEMLGLAYDLKTASPEQVQQRVFQTGDSTHFSSSDEERVSVTAIGPLHPLNPFYTVTYSPPNATIKLN